MKNRLIIFFIKNNQGDMVPLATLTKIEKIAGPDYTTRFQPI